MFYDESGISSGPIASFISANLAASPGRKCAGYSGGSALLLSAHSRAGLHGPHSNEKSAIRNHCVQTTVDFQIREIQKPEHFLT